VTASRRTGAALALLVAGPECPAQDRVVSNSGKVLRATTSPLPFTSTLSFPSLG